VELILKKKQAPVTFEIRVRLTALPRFKMVASWLFANKELSSFAVKVDGKEQMIDDGIKSPFRSRILN
jgi:hypothetical protein